MRLGPKAPSNVNGVTHFQMTHGFDSDPLELGPKAPSYVNGIGAERFRLPPGYPKGATIPPKTAGVFTY